MTNSIIKPTVGRVVWFHPGGYAVEDGFTRHHDGQPYAAIIVRVWSDRMVNLSVFDSNGEAHSRTSVVLAQEGDAVPGSGSYCEWMPYQKGQAGKTEAAEKSAVLEPRYRQPTHREELERIMVQGASPSVAVADPGQAVAVAKSIKAGLDVLCPPVMEKNIAQVYMDARAKIEKATAMAKHSAQLAEGAMAAVSLPVIDPGPDAQEREIAAKAARGCRGPSCGATDGPHSPECILEAAETQGWLDSPEAEEARQALAAKSATLVTLADIEAEIVAEAYMTGEYFLEGGLHVEYSPGWYDYGDAADNLTICVLILRNGTKLVGVNYGAIDPANHCPKKGKKEARAHAIEQAWPLLGFRLRDKLADSQ